MATSIQVDAPIGPPAVPAQPARWASDRSLWWLALVVAWSVAAIHVYLVLDQGWIPHDEGTLAQSAERVLNGELAHRDFSDPYTGGLSYLHALAFKVFGVHLLALRWTLFAAFLVWVPALYYAASRLVRPISAAALTLIAVFWSVPNYPAAMPSWYNLFLATGGVAALMAYMDSSRRYWLVVAGLAGGLSVLVKTTGFFFIGAGLLALLFHESHATRAADAADDRPAGVALRMIVVVPLIAAAAAILGIGLARRLWVDIYQFAVPGLAITGAVGWAILRPPGLSVNAAARIVRAGVPYLVAAALPVVAFASYYAMAGALPELLEGVLLLPARRLGYATMNPPVPWALIPMLVVTFVALDVRALGARLPLVQAGIAVVAVVAALVPAWAMQLQEFVWSSLAESTPVVIVILSALTVWRLRSGEVDPARQSRIMLVGCAAALCSLVQYPFAAPIYFSYSLPLLLLAIAALIPMVPMVRRAALGGITAFYMIYGALYVMPLRAPGLMGPVVQEELAVLDLPRGGLRLRPAEAAGYAKVVELLQEHATSGVIFAGPDAPELYFLAGLHNPTPAIFDFLVPDTLFHEHVVQSMDSSRITAVAIKRSVWHSPLLEPHIEAAFANRFPDGAVVGPITVRWQP